MVNTAVEKGVVSDVTVVPITINYEKIMEGNMYANELSGERKIKESLSSLIRARQVLNSNFGHTTVVFGKPFSLVGWTAEHKARMADPETVARLSRAIAAQPSAAHPSCVAVPETAVTAAAAELKSSKYRMRALAHHVLHELALNIETMPIHIAAALMLQYRHGITAAQLQAKLAWVATELELRGGSLFGFEMESHETLMKQAVSYLGDVLRNQNRNVFEPAISSRGEYNNMLVLGQYKNRLVHYFYREALWCVVIYALSRGKHGAEAECTVDVATALNDVAFLHSMLQSEFVIKENPDEPEDHVATLRLMAEHGIVTLSGGDIAGDLTSVRVTVASTGEAHFSFMCSLLWPFIDSFYSASMMLYTLQPTRSIARDLLVTQTQWLATTLYHESMLSFFEACSKETLDNAFSTLRQLGVVRHTAKDAKGKNVALSGGDASGVALELCPAFQTEDALEGLIGRISAMRKQPPVVKAGSRRNLVADIPILAKINNPMSLSAKF
jgi:glycerone phosphate O-acyltransferase/fatty acyl-CoA reductase